MFDVLFIMVGIIICTWLLSKADIKFTITHKHVLPTNDAGEPVISQSDADDAYKDAPVSMDDVVKAVQDILGGDE